MSIFIFSFNYYFVFSLFFIYKIINYLYLFVFFISYYIDLTFSHVLSLDTIIYFIILNEFDIVDNIYIYIYSFHIEHRLITIFHNFFNQNQFSIRGKFSCENKIGQHRGISAKEERGTEVGTCTWIGRLIAISRNWYAKFTGLCPVKCGAETFIDVSQPCSVYESARACEHVTRRRVIVRWAQGSFTRYVCNVVTHSRIHQVCEREPSRWFHPP